MLAAYRRTGADPPFRDPGGAHGIGMEGYYWRFTDAAAGRVVVALCGACRGAAGDWALVAVAAHPGGFLRWAVVPEVALDPARLGVRAGDALRADARTLRVRIDGAEIDAEVGAERPWPRRSLGALGPGHLVPGLAQYWHPHLLAGRARGGARLDGQAISLDGARVYGEKNWGSRFPPAWWWGQAHDLGDGAASVAFAGGPLRVGAPTAVVVALEDRVLRLAPPLARTATASEPGRWRVRAMGPLHAVELEAEADPATAHRLPVPVIDERRAELRSHQHLAARLALTVRRGRRVLVRAETDLAGVERGQPD